MGTPHIDDDSIIIKNLAITGAVITVLAIGLIVLANVLV